MPSAEAANLAAVRAVADAVLYKGHRSHPHWASAAGNRSRWQLGVLGPPAAGRHAFAVPPDMAMQCLVAPADRPARVTIHLRFQQVQVRQTQRRLPDGSHAPVDALTVADVLSSDEAVQREITWPAVPVTGTAEFPVAVPGGADVESVPGGRIVRRRAPLTARVRTRAEPDDGLLRLTVAVANEHPAPVADRHTAARCSLIGAHLLLQAHHAAFVSLLDPPPAAAAAAARCHQHRCWPVLAGRPGSSDVVLGAPIMLYDHPAVAGQAARGTAVLVGGDVPVPVCRTSAVPSRSSDVTGS
jgi:hypothetical protein